MDSIQIILVEILLVLVAGVGFLFFRAQKKKSAMRSQLATLLKKVTAGEPERKTMLIAQFKALRVNEGSAEERADQLLVAEKACIRHFISCQLMQQEKDIASFHEAIYGLSAVYFVVNEKHIETAQELTADEELESTLEESGANAADDTDDNGDIEIMLEVSGKEAAVLPEKDEIDVSLDIDELDETIDLKPEPERQKSSVIEEMTDPFNIDDIVNEAFKEVESGSKKSNDA